MSNTTKEGDHWLEKEIRLAKERAEEYEKQVAEAEHAAQTARNNGGAGKPSEEESSAGQWASAVAGEVRSGRGKF